MEEKNAESVIYRIPVQITGLAEIFPSSPCRISLPAVVPAVVKHESYSSKGGKKLVQRVVEIFLVKLTHLLLKRRVWDEAETHRAFIIRINYSAGTSKRNPHRREAGSGHLCCCSNINCLLEAAVADSRSPFTIHST